MSSSAYGAPLVLEPRPSARLALLLVAPAGIALAVLPLVGLPGWARLLLAAGITAGTLRAVLRHSAPARGSRPARLLWRATGDWEIQRADGSVTAARLGRGGLVTRWLIVLNLRPEGGGRETLLLTSDRLAADTLRRLRVGLLASDAGAAAGADALR